MYNSSDKSQTKKTSHDRSVDRDSADAHSGPAKTGSKGSMASAYPNPTAYGASSGNHSGPYGNYTTPAYGQGANVNHHQDASDYDDDIDDINAIWAASSMNMFGRSFRETLNDFPKINRKKGRWDDDTPSLTSDNSDSTSRTSSSYGPSQLPAYNNVAPPPSAYPKDSSSRLAPKIYIASEHANAQPFNNHYPSAYGNERGIQGSEYYQGNNTSQGDVSMSQQKVSYPQSYYGQPASQYSKPTARKGSSSAK